MMRFHRFMLQCELHNGEIAREKLVARFKYGRDCPTHAELA
jgi:hypothetical protein